MHDTEDRGVWVQWEAQAEVNKYMLNVAGRYFPSESDLKP